MKENKPLSSPPEATINNFLGINRRVLLYCALWPFTDCMTPPHPANAAHVHTEQSAAFQNKILFRIREGHDLPNIFR